VNPADLLSRSLAVDCAEAKLAKVLVVAHLPLVQESGQVDRGFAPKASVAALLVVATPSANFSGTSKTSLVTASSGNSQTLELAASANWSVENRSYFFKKHLLPLPLS
jgi:hypothetical protein